MTSESNADYALERNESILVKKSVSMTLHTYVHLTLFKMKTKIIFLLILHKSSQTFKGSVFTSEPPYPVLHTVPLCQMKTLTLEKNVQPKT